MRNQRHDLKTLIGKRLLQAREEARKSQQEIADQLGFKNRQIISNIESGIRKVSSDELIALMNLLNKSLEYFTDPYLVTTENAFSWRAECESIELGEYETRTRKFIGAYLRFSNLLGETANPIAQTLSLARNNSFEDACFAGETLAEQWELGDIPAKNLAGIIESKLDIQIVYIDAPSGVSGAACHLPELDVILINRNDPAKRRNWDLAHETFHLLTWESMPPVKIDVERYADRKSASRIENLADNFSAGLLMPEKILKPLWGKHDNLGINSRINTTAQTLCVSSKALYYRVKNLGWLSNEDEAHIIEDQLIWHEEEDKPKIYSSAFVDKLHAVLAKGLVSVRKAAELLDCNIEDIKSLLHEYEKLPPFEL